MNKKNEVLTNLELSSFCKQMSMILKAGISPIEGISMMIEDSQNENEKQLLEKIYEDLTMTSSLAISLKKTSVFPDYMIQMLEIGEETGRNDEVMDALSHHYQREDFTKYKECYYLSNDHDFDDGCHYCYFNDKSNAYF